MTADGGGQEDSIILNLQIACKASIHLAMHAICRQRPRLRQDSRDAFNLLEQAAIINADIAMHMRAMVGFRNITVQQYQDLSMPVLHATLDNHLDDFRQFSGKLIRHGPVPGLS